MDADTDTSRAGDKSRSDEEESPEAETWRYLERLERRAQLRKIRREHERSKPVEAQPEREGEDFL